MKCIQCGTDNKLRDRTANQGRCKNCNHQFAFEPTTQTKFKLTDPLFAKAITDISGNGSLFFTQNQLFCFLSKRLASSHTMSTSRTIVGAVFGFVFISVWSSLFFGGILSAIFKISLVGVILNIVQIFFIYNFFRIANNSNNSTRTRRDNALLLQLLGIAIIGISLVDKEFIFPANILSLFTTFLGIISISLGTFLLIRQSKVRQTSVIDQAQLQEWLNRWQKLNGSITKLLPKPNYKIEPTAVNSEVSAYSFDRVIVCDRATIAQLLIANNFHFENNCAILSITGYPQNIFNTVMQMLRRNSDLKVYALHDASPRGIKIVHTLRTNPNWFQNSNVTIYDLGLLPRQILKSRNVFVQATAESAQQVKQLPDEVRQNLTKEELEWLEAGNFVELESFTPQKLLQVITQGIAKSRTPNITDSLVPIDSSGGSYIFTADSFG